jgi:hypothetical protein
VLRSAVTLTFLLAAGGASAEEPLASLLGQLAPAEVPQGSVEVMGWIERGGGGRVGPELVVTLVPKGAVKLVADPGVTVTPVARAGLDWGAGAPVSETDPDGGYFAEPPVVRVPFAGEDGRPVEAEVEYAYCVVDYQCLFGTARVTAATEVPPPG